ncbi:MAG: hypothetical protein AAF555_08525 [Verrucomicrobiota bacterium]
MTPRKDFLASLLPLALCLVSSAMADETITFTVSLDTEVDSGNTYENFSSTGDTSLSSIYAIGFQVEISNIGGTSYDFDHAYMTFCGELGESIGTNEYTFNITSLENVSRGRAGEAGHTSASIPEGGIGAFRAARVRYLYDNFYTADELSDWTMSQASPNTQAFQLALWELTHDSDLSLLDAAGNMYLGDQSSTTEANALLLAQSWLDSVAAADVDESYQSTTWGVWALEDIGSPGNQDVLFATRIDEPEFAIFQAAAIPEPQVSLLGFLSLLAFSQRKRPTS